MNKTLTTLLFLVLTLFAQGQPVQHTLHAIIQMAQNQSPLAKQAETRKENFYWQYQLFKSNYNPQLSLSGGLPGYNSSFTPVTQPDGSVQYLPVAQTNSFLNLGLVQPISTTGGSLSVNSGASQFRNIVDNQTNWRSSIIDLTLNQPLFAFNPLKWDKKTEPIRYEESKRSFVEEMESVSLTATAFFFNYLDAQINYEIAAFNLANNDTIYNIEKGRYNIGTASEDKLLQVELQLLRSRQELAQAQLDLQSSSLTLRAFLGLNEAPQFDLILPENIPLFVVEEETALQYAKQYRADYIAFRRRKIEADKEISAAKGQRFQMDLNLSFGLNSAAASFNESYTDANSQQVANISLNLPILDWGRNEAQVKTALANKKLTDYIISQEEQNFEQEILTQVRQLEVLRQQIEIAKKSDAVAQKRYEVAQNRYLIGKIDITNLNIALTEKDQAKRSYISALRTFWSGYYELRRLTLYDFVNNAPLYKADL